MVTAVWGSPDTPKLKLLLLCNVLAYSPAVVATVVTGAVEHAYGLCNSAVVIVIALCVAVQQSYCVACDAVDHRTSHLFVHV
jgi:hypothetical protein